METKHQHEKIGIRRLDKFDATELLGTSHPVVLYDAVDEKFCETCGEVLGHIIPNFKGLISSVAVFRTSKATKLNGKDIKFLRKSLKKKAKEFAGDIAISPEQLSRFENDKQVISPVYERLLRAAVFLGHWDDVDRLCLNRLDLFQLEIPSVRSINDNLVFEFGLKKGLTDCEPATSGTAVLPPWMELAS